MMQVDVVCRFCHRRLSPHKYYTDPGVAHGNHYAEFNCAPCRSTQFFEITGRPLHYFFDVGKYHLYFMTNPRIFQCCNGLLGPIFELNYHPNFTPQNTTEERIKTLILFS